RMTTEPLLYLDPVPAGTFTTDASVYLAHRIAGAGDSSRYQFTVISRFENRGSVPLFLGRCFPNSVQPLFTVFVADTSGNESAYAQPWACIDNQAQFEVAPGRARLDTLQVAGPNLFDSRTRKLIGVTEGSFRMLFDVRLGPGTSSVRAPDSLLLSNVFVVRRLN
ncbi:MAG: hypothetical protein ACHQQ3_14880, partial [Gemmatimonadales bacterium]